MIRIAHFLRSKRINPSFPIIGRCSASKISSSDDNVDSTTGVKPNAWGPYVELARLHKPTGALLLLWPCLYGAAMATEPGSWPEPRVAVALALGATLMRGSGCAWNDAADADIDRQVSRTATRPVARGALTTFQARSAAVAMAAAAGVSTVALAPSAILPALAATPLAALYPFTKRFTVWPQAALGLAFSCGAPVGYAAQRASSYNSVFADGIDAWVAGCSALDPQAWSVLLPLMAHCMLWTLSYDTVYAYQDKKEDAKLGIGSSALQLGTGMGARVALAAWTAASSSMLLVALRECDGIHSYGSWSVALFAMHGLWQFATFQPENPKWCDMAFRSHALLGGAILLAIIADRTYGRSKTQGPKCSKSQSVS